MRTKKQEGFDYQNFEKDALRALYEGKPLEEALGLLLKRIVEAGLQGEMQAHLEEGKASGVKNRRNGKMSKTVRRRVFSKLCQVKKVSIFHQNYTVYHANKETRRI